MRFKGGIHVDRTGSLWTMADTIIKTYADNRIIRNISYEVTPHKIILKWLQFVEPQTGQGTKFLTDLKKYDYKVLVYLPLPMSMPWVKKMMKLGLIDEIIDDEL